MMSLTNAAALIHISDHDDGIYPLALVDPLEISIQGVRYCLDTLQAQGFIQREKGKSENGRTCYIYTATEKGERRAYQLEKYIEKIANRGN